MQISQKTGLIIGLATVIAAGPALGHHTKKWHDAKEARERAAKEALEKKSKLTDPEAMRMEKMRKKLEKENEDLVQRRIEKIRLLEERKIARKLKAAFSEDSDEVTLGQASPSRVQVNAQNIKNQNTSETKHKVIPRLSVTSIKADSFDFESNPNFGLDVETSVTKHISVGIGVNYFTLGFNDKRYRPDNGFFFLDDESNTGIETDYTQLNVSAYGKFFPLPNSRIKPFIGLGLGYNNSKTEYEGVQEGIDYLTQDGDLPNDSFVNGGDYSVNQNFINATVSAGAEISFNRTIGAMIEVRYSRALSEKDESRNVGNVLEDRINELSAQIVNADTLNFGAGLLVNF
ncbi:MAG: outer membrane beta-barrel protein [Bacteriovoracaceae bacterium]